MRLVLSEWAEYLLLVQSCHVLHAVRRKHNMRNHSEKWRKIVAGDKSI